MRYVQSSDTSMARRTYIIISNTIAAPYQTLRFEHNKDKHIYKVKNKTVYYIPKEFVSQIGF
jgi:hypothetical protein